jgi:hypothetical protein
MYLDDPAFQEQHNGPPFRDRDANTIGRDPSPEQIAARAAAIRASWSEVISASGWTILFDRWWRLHRMSEATHIPHGISEEAFGIREPG